MNIFLRLPHIQTVYRVKKIIAFFCLFLISFYSHAGSSSKIASPEIFSIATTVTVLSDFNPVCLGANLTLTATVSPAAATGTVQFFDGATLLGLSTVGSGTATLVTSFSTSGSHSITAIYSGDPNYTTSTSAIFSQLVDAAIPVTPGAIIGSVAMCSGVASLTYSISNVANATIYNWTFPSGWTITAGAGTTNITVTSGTTSGSVSVTAGNSCGNSAAQTKAVTVTVIPATPGAISGPTPVCPSTPGNIYSISAVTGATGYTWTMPSGWTINSGGGTISVTVTSGTAAGNILVAATNGCGSSATPKNISINPVVATNNTGYTDSTTKSSDGIIAGTTLPERRGYLKFPLSALPAGVTVTASNLKLTNIVSSSSGGPSYVKGLGANDPVTASAAILFGAAGYLSNGIVYNVASWTATGQISLTLNATANTDITNSLASPGYIAMGLVRSTANIYNFNGYSAGANAPLLSLTYASIRSFPVTLNPAIPATPSTISGLATTCPNSTGYSYSVTAVANATTYTWAVPTGWVITSGQGTTGITVTTGSTGQSGNITVTAGNSCGTSAAQTLAVTVAARPTVSATPATQEVCTGLSIGAITISNPNGVTGTTFTWTRDNPLLTGMALLGSGSTITGILTNSTASQLTTNFTIYAAANGCTSTSPVVVAVAVNPKPIANAGIDQSTCTLTAATIGGSPTASGGTASYTYLWTAGVSNQTIANPTATPGTYSVTVTDAKGCQATDAVVLSVSTGTKTWVGTGTSGSGPDNNFNNPSNWSPVGVPGACNDVVINIDVTNILNFFSGNLTNTFAADATIKSLQLVVSGTIIATSNTTFTLAVGSHALTILNTTSINTTASTVLADPAKTIISVGSGGVLTYGGTLTTAVSGSNTDYPIYAATNNTGKVYLNSNATLAGIGNDPSNKPAQVIFNGTGTQTITNNSGSQIIYLGAASTEIGETNSPTVVLAGSGSSGFQTAGNLNVNNTSTLDIGTLQSFNRSTSGGSLNLSSGSFLKLGRNTGGTGTSNFPSNFTIWNFNATSTVDYNAAADQSVFNSPLYGNLTVSNSGNKIPSGSVTAQNNITIQGAAILTGATNTFTLGGNWTNYNQSGFNEQTSTVNFNGTGAETITTTGGEIFYNLKKSAAGTTTMLSDVTVQGAGSPSYTLSAGTFDAGTYTFASAAGTFNISGGLLKLAKTGATLLPEFAIATYNNTGGTIELYGSGDQVLRGARAYRNLTFSTSGIKTVSASIPSVTGTVLTQNSVTVDVSQNVMGGAGTNLTMTGTSLYRTAGAGVKPDALGIYSLGTGTTVEFTNSTATNEDIRLTLPVYYNAVVSGNNVSNSSAATGIKFQTGGTFTVKNGGLFKLANNAGFSGAVATSIDNTNNPSVILEDGSTVEYYAGATGTNPQAITNVIPYYHLIFSGTSLKTAPTGILTVKGNLNNTGSGFFHNTGTVLFNGTTLQNYNSTGTILDFYNLTSANSNNLNINADLTIANQLSLSSAGKLNLVNGNITLRSVAANTAAVDKINIANSLTYSGTGRFIVERFIPTGISHAKTWQFLSAPAFGQTLNACWQEGNGPLVVGSAGLGTTITSDKPGAISRGYDFYTAGSGSSIKTYNPVTGAWAGVDDGTTATSALQMANSKGYMIFVRGDRSVQTSSAAANPTTLRTKGKIYSPGTDAPPSSAVAANKLGSVGNPYASAIDFVSLMSTSTGLDGKYYVWDPSLAGSLGYGGYQVFSSVTGWLPTPGGTTNYPTGTAYTKIQSGQAFFVYSTPGGTVNFNENNKISGSRLVNRQTDDNRHQFLRSYLYSSNGSLADGNLVAFDQSFSDAFTSDDALKIPVAGENLAIAHSNNILSVDARNVINGSDTIFYNISGLRQQSYALKIAPENMNAPGLSAFLADKFNHTKQHVSLTDSTNINFNITTDPLSAVPDRFYIVFTRLKSLPVTNIDLHAERDEAKISLSWQVQEQQDIKQYSVQRSADGRNFTTLAVIPAMANLSEYHYADLSLLLSDNYYRIVAGNNISRNKYSRIVKIAGEQISASVSVSPNPVINHIINLQFSNCAMGEYNVQLINNAGQVVYRTSVIVSSMLFVKPLSLGRGLAQSNYQLVITGPDTTKYINELIIN